MLIASNMFFYAIKIIASRIHPPPLSCLCLSQHQLLCIPSPGRLAPEELEHWNGPAAAGGLHPREPLRTPAEMVLADRCSGSEPGLGQATSRGPCQPPPLWSLRLFRSFTAALGSESFLCHFFRK